ncbi:MAG TPA: replicative DNA helicase [Phycisphaerales bacterium]|nr:replicative DNA helicase [Phycisphaerales bacterium]|tara:strand:- start:59328 stop:60755 length:1428 start_codon:yes stop_codon:yes gene_type:complete
MSEKKRYKKKDDEQPDIDLSKIFDKMPPNAYEAECALLGSMILDSEVIGDVVQIMSGEKDFYKASHGVVYKTLVDIYDKAEPVDLVHLKQRLDDQNQLEGIGGIEYLVELVEAVPSALSAPYYAKIVNDKAVLRGLIGSATDILHKAYHTAEPVDNQVDIAEQAIFNLRQNGNSNEATLLKQLLEEALDRIDTHDGRSITGVETGYYEFDEMTSGLQNGEMIILAARPSMGKTALGLNMAEHIAVANKQPVAVFSLEMGKAQLAERLMASNSGVDSQKIRKRMLGGDDFLRLQESCAALSEAPLYIDDTPGLSILALRAKARRLAARYGIKAIMIDYLQLMSDPGSESRQQEVSNISRNVKGLARDLNVPVVCLSQLNRGAENREGHRPRMADLRESGSIEQDADVVLMLHREEYFHNGDEEWKQAHPELVGTAEIIIAKQRNGPTGSVHLQFHGATTRFNNLSHAAPGSGVSAF